MDGVGRGVPSPAWHRWQLLDDANAGPAVDEHPRRTCSNTMSRRHRPDLLSQGPPGLDRRQPEADRFGRPGRALQQALRRPQPRQEVKTALARLPVLETARLILRPFRADDADAQAAMMGDAEVMRHIGGQACRARTLGANCSAAPACWSIFGWGYWAVERRADGADDRPARLRRLQARHDPVDRRACPKWAGCSPPRRAGRASPPRPALAALDWIDSASCRRPKSPPSSTPRTRRRSGSRRSSASATREEARYKGEPILLFRRRA